MLPFSKPLVDGLEEGTRQIFDNTALVRLDPAITCIPSNRRSGLPLTLIALRSELTFVGYTTLSSTGTTSSDTTKSRPGTVPWNVKWKSRDLDFDRLSLFHEAHVLVLDLVLDFEGMFLLDDPQQLLSRCHDYTDRGHSQPLDNAVAGLRERLESVF